MAKLFKNKYRTETTRLKGWDYGNSANYFITICTKDRTHFFGEVVKGKMKLSRIGKQVELEWQRTLEVRPDMNLKLGEFVVMPDYFHAIICIGKNEYNSSGISANRFGPQRKNLASVIRGFKSSVTIHARTINKDFQWQSRYHDHIIRNQGSLERISNYIINNPSQWEQDKKRRDREFGFTQKRGFDKKS